MPAIVFGSKPGAYGAGLQGLIDERCWENAQDLAEAYINGVATRTAIDFYKIVTRQATRIPRRKVRAVLRALRLKRSLNNA